MLEPRNTYPLASPDRIQEPFGRMKGRVEIDRIGPAVSICELGGALNMPDILPFPGGRGQLEGVFWQVQHAVVVCPIISLYTIYVNSFVFLPPGSSLFVH